MSIETKLREGSQAIKQSTGQAVYTSKSPANRPRALNGPVLAVTVGLVVAALLALPVMVAGVGGKPEDEVGFGFGASPGDGLAPAEVATPSSVDGTTIVPEVDTTEAVAAQLGGSVLSDERLKTITGLEPDMARNGYLVDSTTTSDGSYELGLIVFEQTLPSEGPETCLLSYAMTEGANVAGGSICGSDPEAIADIASFHLSIGGSCGEVPKEQPVVEGVWTLLTAWGIPQAIDTVTVQLTDGSTARVAAANGFAHQLWESSVGIESLVFDGMSDAQREVVASYLPHPGIDC